MLSIVDIDANKCLTGDLLSKRQNAKRGSVPQCCLQRDSQALNNQPFHSNNLSKQERPLGHGGKKYTSIFCLRQSEGLTQTTKRRGAGSFLVRSWVL